MSLDLLPGVPPPEGEDCPYTQPLRWKGWRERFGVERPYATPEDEFMRNAHCPTMGQLMARWQGLPEAADIALLFNDPTIYVKRAQAQDAKRKPVDVSFLSDPAYVARETAYEILNIKARLESFEADLQRGFVITIETEGNLVDGYKRAEKRRIISPAMKIAISKEMRELEKHKAVLEGRLAPEGGTSEGIGDMILRAMMEKGHLSATGHTMEELEAIASGKALPRPEIRDVTADAVVTR